MAEPVTAATSSYATASLFGVTLLTLFPGIDAGIVLGAFAGAVVFVLSSAELKALRKFGFFTVAFFAGMVGAATTTSLLTWALPAHVAVNPAVGALITAAVAVKLLLWLIGRADNPLAVLDALRQKGGSQ